MYSPLKQFVSSAICLKCDGCCRFREAKSCWRPKVTDSEKEAAARLTPREKIFAEKIFDPGQTIRTIPWQEQHLCYFFHVSHNTCGIYPRRPFECRLYPFVITQGKSGLVLSVHLACPFIQEKRNTPDFQGYVAVLKDFFEQKATIRFLQEYLRLDHTYRGFEQELEEFFPITARTDS